MFQISGRPVRNPGPDILYSLFDWMRARDQITPSPGFYGRVLSCIEAQRRESIWVPFIYSRSYRSFVTAVLGVSIALSSYVLAAERDGPEAQQAMAGASLTNRIFASTSIQQRRDAVLTELVTYSRPE